jgi:hypothetical protein
MGDVGSAASERDTTRVLQPPAGQSGVPDAKPQVQTKAPEAKTTPGQAFQDGGDFGAVTADKARVSDAVVNVSFSKVQSWFFEHRDAPSILAALKGSEFTNSEKRELLDIALSDYSHFAFEKIEQLATLAQDPKVDSDARGLIAEALLKRVADPGDAYNPSGEARAYAFCFGRAMKDHPREMVELIAKLEPKQAAELVRALSREHLSDTRLANGGTPGWHDDRHIQRGLLPDEHLNDQDRLAKARDQIFASFESLKGLGEARRPAIGIVVNGLAEASTFDLQQTVAGVATDHHPAAAPDLPQHLAAALAVAWNPENPPVEQLTALLKSPAGISLICSGTPEWRDVVREVLRTNLDGIATALESPSGDPRLNPRVADAVAAKLVIGLRGGQAPLLEADQVAIGRVSASLQTASGHELLFGQASREARDEALRIIVDDLKGMSEADVKQAFANTDEPWELPIIAGTYAKKIFGGLQSRNLDGLTQTGMKNLALLYKGDKPRGLHLSAEEMREARDSINDGELPPFLNDKDFFPDDKDFATTRSLRLDPVIFFSEDGPQLDFVLYGTNLDGSEYCIDQLHDVFTNHALVDDKYRETARTAYQNLLGENRLAEGTLYLGGSAYGRRQTPLARDTTAKVKDYAATGLSVAGLVALASNPAGWAGAALAVAGALGDGYFLADGVSQLAWLHQHGHDLLHPDREALSLELSTLASVTGLGAPVTKAVAREAREAGLLSRQAERAAARAAHDIAALAGAAATNYQWVDLIQHPEKITAQDVLQLVTSHIHVARARNEAAHVLPHIPPEARPSQAAPSSGPTSAKEHPNSTERWGKILDEAERDQSKAQRPGASNKPDGPVQPTDGKPTYDGTVTWRAGEPGANSGGPPAPLQPWWSSTPRDTPSFADAGGASPTGAGNHSAAANPNTQHMAGDNNNGNRGNKGGDGGSGSNRTGVPQSQGEPAATPQAPARTTAESQHPSAAKIPAEYEKIRGGLDDPDTLRADKIKLRQQRAKLKDQINDALQALYSQRDKKDDGNPPSPEQRIENLNKADQQAQPLKDLLHRIEVDEAREKGQRSDVAANIIPDSRKNPELLKLIPPKARGAFEANLTKCIQKYAELRPEGGYDISVENFLHATVEAAANTPELNSGSNTVDGQFQQFRKLSDAFQELIDGHARVDKQSRLPVNLLEAALGPSGGGAPPVGSAPAGSTPPGGSSPKPSSSSAPTHGSPASASAPPAVTQLQGKPADSPATTRPAPAQPAAQAAPGPTLVVPQQGFWGLPGPNLEGMPAFTTGNGGQTNHSTAAAQPQPAPNWGSMLSPAQPQWRNPTLGTATPSTVVPANLLLQQEPTGQHPAHADAGGASPTGAGNHSAAANPNTQHMAGDNNNGNRGGKGGDRGNGGGKTGAPPTAAPPATTAPPTPKELRRAAIAAASQPPTSERPATPPAASKPAPAAGTNPGAPATASPRFAARKSELARSLGTWRHGVARALGHIRTAGTNERSVEWADGVLQRYRKALIASGSPSPEQINDFAGLLRNYEKLVGHPPPVEPLPPAGEPTGPKGDGGSNTPPASVTPPPTGGTPPTAPSAGGTNPGAPGTASPRAGSGKESDAPTSQPKSENAPESARPKGGQRATPLPKIEKQLADLQPKIDGLVRTRDKLMAIEHRTKEEQQNLNQTRIGLERARVSRIRLTIAKDAASANSTSTPPAPEPATPAPPAAAPAGAPAGRTNTAAPGDTPKAAEGGPHPGAAPPKDPTRGGGGTPPPAGSAPPAPAGGSPPPAPATGGSAPPTSTGAAPAATQPQQGSAAPAPAHAAATGPTPQIVWQSPGFDFQGVPPHTDSGWTWSNPTFGVPANDLPPHPIATAQATGGGQAPTAHAGANVAGPSDRSAAPPTTQRAAGANGNGGGSGSNRGGERDIAPQGDKPAAETANPKVSGPQSDSLADVETQLHQINRKISDLRASLTQQTNVTAAELELREALAERQRLEQQRANLRRTATHFQSKLDDVNAKIGSVKSEINDLIAKYTKELHRLGVAELERKNHLNAIQSERSKAEARLDNLYRTQQAIRGRLTTARRMVGKDGGTTTPAPPTPEPGHASPQEIGGTPSTTTAKQTSTAPSPGGSGAAPETVRPGQSSSGRPQTLAAAKKEVERLRRELWDPTSMRFRTEINKQLERAIENQIRLDRESRRDPNENAPATSSLRAAPPSPATSTPPAAKPAAGAPTDGTNPVAASPGAAPSNERHTKAITDATTTPKIDPELARVIEEASDRVAELDNRLKKLTRVWQASDTPENRTAAMEAGKELREAINKKRELEQK